MDSFDKISKKVTPEVRRYISASLDIVDRVDSILKKKGMTRLDLAQDMGESNIHLASALTGLKNLDIKFICKMEIALGERIINIVK